MEKCSFSDQTILGSLWQWRNTKLAETVKYEVIFPMSVVVNDYINIYCGMNDCSAANLKIKTSSFTETIKNQTFITV